MFINETTNYQYIVSYNITWETGLPKHSKERRQNLDFESVRIKKQGNNFKKRSIYVWNDIFSYNLNIFYFVDMIVYIILYTPKFICL